LFDYEKLKIIVVINYYLRSVIYIPVIISLILKVIYLKFIKNFIKFL